MVTSGLKKTFLFFLFGWLMLVNGAMAQSGVVPGPSASGNSGALRVPPSAGDEASVVSGNNRFAFDLYQQFNDGAIQKSKNMFFSPISLSTALAMTFSGARMETESQMAKVLHFELNQNQLHPAFASLMARMQGGKGYQLVVANALWPQKEYPFLKDFMDIGTRYYQAGVQALDYAGDTEGARGTINRWVEQKTQNKIKELIKPDILTALTRLVLTNAVYFKGSWDTQFDPARTRSMAFRISDSQTVDVPMMYQSSSLPYYEDDVLQVLELPYAGKELSMLVVLPSRESGMAKVEAMLSAGSMEKWVSSLKEEKVEVFLPKFRMTCDYALNPVLTRMGMPDAFDVLKADFSGMTGNKQLYIAAVIHKAFVDVNEEGTEAAAATAVVVATKSISINPQFRADRPFVFVIRDKKTGIILFMGRVMNPLDAGE